MAVTRRIQLLDDLVINQIAAGEVVERPLSVVKELTENALDAGADHIEIEINEGGLAGISVVDNGSGIAHEELGLALQRHCTSKIRSAEQLLALSTLGFRGEALASIAAVSNTVVISRTKEESHAWRIDSRHGRLGAVKPAPSYPAGTSIRVSELFENTPARRKFQKQARTEYLQILQYLKQIAFCHEQVEFVVRADEKRVLRVPRLTAHEDSQARRAQAIFGKDFSRAAIVIIRQEPGFRLRGYLGQAGYHRPRADLQYITLNNRVIRDQSLLHAMRLAYDGKVPEGRYSAFALDLCVPESEVDINVHPAKSQVRFAHARNIHDQLLSLVSQELETDTPLFSHAGIEAVPLKPKLLPTEHMTPSFMPAGARTHYVADSASHKPRYASGTKILANDASARFGFHGFIVDAYALLSTPSGTEIIDAAAFFARLFLMRLTTNQSSRPLILPEPIAEEFKNYFATNQEACAEQGLILDTLGPETFVLREVPVVLPPLDYQRFIQKLAGADGANVAENIACAAASCLSVPADEEGKKRWFEQLLAQAESLELEWRQFLVRKSPDQWRAFLLGSVS